MPEEKNLRNSPIARYKNKNSTGTAHEGNTAIMTSNRHVKVMKTARETYPVH